MVIAVCMHVTVIDLFRRCLANADHFHIEMQGLARHLVVAVDGDLVAIYRLDGDVLVAVFALGWWPSTPTSS